MSETRDQGLLRWVPAGLLIAATLAVGRTLGLVAAAERSLPGLGLREREILRWEHVGGLPEQLVQGLVLGLVAAALADGALRGGRELRALLAPFLFVSVVLAMGLIGWPLDPPALRAGVQGFFAFDDLTSCLLLAVLLTLFLFGSLQAARRGRGFLIAGPLGLVLGLAALAAPLIIALRASSKTPTFERLEIVREILHDPHAWNVLAARPEHPPHIALVTPDAQGKSDSADKPALVLPPPARVSFRITAQDGPLRLRAAAGLDMRLRPWLIERKLERAQVDFRVHVNGEERFAARVAVEGQWDPREYADNAFVWHHVGGAQGLALAPGDEVVLETSIPEGDPAADAPPELLLPGFGPLLLERVRELPRATASPSAPNLLLVVMDTQRVDRLSCYGHTRPTTPHIDALAERGVLFEDVHSTSSWTWPATASILTGLPADAHGVVSNASCTLQLGLDSLPEVLQERGYTTAAFSCNPLISVERSFDQGFEFFDHLRTRFRMSDEVTPQIVDWLRAHRGVRFFLYLHLADPHTPHRPHAEEVARLGFVAPPDFPEQDEHGQDGMDQYNKLLRNDTSDAGYEELIPAAHRVWIDQQYDASVATGDRWLGVILAELEALGLAETTVVAFTSDHGEELFDHGLLEHGHTLYSELVHVPLILAGPGIPRGLRVPGVVSNRHLGPTLARLGGAQLEDAEAFDARFLLEALDAPSDEEDSALFQTLKGDFGTTRGQALYGLREGPWVLHWRRRGELTRADLRLYNVDADPHQTIDLVDSEQALAAQMQARLARRLAAQEAWAPEHRVGAGAATREMLQGLGLGYMSNEEDEER